MSIQIRSDAFSPGSAIPVRFTADGDDVSPPLKWSGVPENTRELALIVEDPDAPQPTPFVHWVMAKIPADADGLSEGVPTRSHPDAPIGAVQGKTSFKKIGYGGPAPPKGHGTHHYHFRLFALDKPIEVQGELNKDSLLTAMSGHVLAQGDLVGTYIRE